MDPTKILLKSEVQAVLAWLHHPRRRGPNHHVNLAVFRLSCCCGLRVMELCGLNIGDVVTDGPRPVIRIRKANTKGRHLVSPNNPEGKDFRKGRLVPLWWDSGTLHDLAAFKARRLAQIGAKAADAVNEPFVCGVSLNAGKRLTTDLAAKRWRSLMRQVLGEERARQLHIHCGRHSFPSHASSAGRSLVEIMQALGHTNPATTGIYLHALESERARDVFAIESGS